MKGTEMQLGTRVALILLAAHCAMAAGLPVEPEERPVAPADVRFVTLGAPADTLALRVSLCHGPGFRGESHSFVIVEELVWPPTPPPIVFEHGGPPAEDTGEDAWLLRAHRIPGGHLQAECRKLPPLPRGDGVRMRAGDLRVRGVEKPFRFVAWLSPLEFAVEDDDGRYTIRRTGPGLFDLVSVERVR